LEAPDAQIAVTYRGGSGASGNVPDLEAPDAQIAVTYRGGSGASGNVPEPGDVTGTDGTDRDVTVCLEWPVEVGPHSSTAVSWRITVTDPTTVVAGAESSAEWDAVTVQAGDSRLSSWVRSAIGDLQALRMVTR
ncbi:hypothetical protein AB4Z22_45310, partial [Paenibacillus sp. TAF58]